MERDGHFQWIDARYCTILWQEHYARSIQQRIESGLMFLDAERQVKIKPSGPTAFAHAESVSSPIDR